MSTRYGESGYGEGRYGGIAVADVDKLMGWRGDTPVWTAFRIDYALQEDIRLDADGEPRFDGTVKSPTADHPDHPPKTGYGRKVLVEDAATRDEVTDYLDGRGIAYTVEDVTTTADEQAAIEDYGARHGVEAVDALVWDAALEAADSVEDLKAIERGEHPDTGEAFEPPPRDRS